MKYYGLRYQGSKSLIADTIMDILPAGERFVDLFHGGFAMSECAIRSASKYYRRDAARRIKKLEREIYDYQRFRKGARKDA